MCCAVPYLSKGVQICVRLVLKRHIRTAHRNTARVRFPILDHACRVTTRAAAATTAAATAAAAVMMMMVVVSQLWDIE